MAAALSATSLGCDVILTEETDWLGGQLTSQAVPPDEHPWIERFGSTKRYREFRALVRQFYKESTPLRWEARKDPFLNPGEGLVSALCHEPRVGAEVLERMLAWPQSCGKLRILRNHKPVAVELDGNFADRIQAVKFLNLKDGSVSWIEAIWILDATELGDLLPLSGCEYVTGRESRAQTGELHAVDGPPEPQSMQAFTWCFAISHDPDADHTISKPQSYEFWKAYRPNVNPPWPGPLFSWDQGHPTAEDPNHMLTMRLFPRGPGDGKSRWLYRRILFGGHFETEHAVRDISLINWSQNDYLEGSIIDRPEEEVARHLQASRELSLSLLYWLQTEAPRPDGGTGNPGLYLRPDAMGTLDGLAKAPYIRESRRIQAVTTITENHVGVVARKQLGLPPHAEVFSDSVGVGAYSIDLHLRCDGKSSGLNLAAYPYQIPMGALLPRRMENLLAAGKNLGATHISNGCTRLHPVEWNVGESAGLLAATSLLQNVHPRQIQTQPDLLKDFHRLLSRQGVEIEMDWATIGAL